LLDPHGLVDPKFEETSRKIKRFVDFYKTTYSFFMKVVGKLKPFSKVQNIWQKKYPLKKFSNIVAHSIFRGAIKDSPGICRRKSGRKVEN